MGGFTAAAKQWMYKVFFSEKPRPGGSEVAAEINGVAARLFTLTISQKKKRCTHTRRLCREAAGWFFLLEIIAQCGRLDLQVKARVFNHFAWCDKKKEKMEQKKKEVEKEEG